MEKKPLIYSVKNFNITIIKNYVDRSDCDCFDGKETVFMRGGGMHCEYFIIGKNAFYTEEAAKQKLKKDILEEIQKLLLKIEEI